ncbi:hypothetical protein OG777_23605 [Micromonospora peucetia]|uniref:hypothetical protein n=1 Tax=Micromonospora peucetia TaxID=47871 RepID=UPI00159F06B0|nr:hypothetical protein [Micromonospora peucetia]MCX4389899.1 hypothetical protein [Micromonospora peucetia]
MDIDKHDVRLLASNPITWEKTSFMGAGFRRRPNKIVMKATSLVSGWPGGTREHVRVHKHLAGNPQVHVTGGLGGGNEHGCGSHPGQSLQSKCQAAFGRHAGGP